MSARDELRHAGNHAITLNGEDGTITLAPGDMIAARDVPERDRHYVDEGILAPVVEMPSNEPADSLTGDDLDKRARELGIEGRSKMRADELRTAVEQREEPNDAEGGE